MGVLCEVCDLPIEDHFITTGHTPKSPQLPTFTSDVVTVIERLRRADLSDKELKRVAVIVTREEAAALRTYRSRMSGNFMDRIMPLGYTRLFGFRIVVEEEI